MIFPEKFHKEDWEVRDIPLSLAREIVEKYHYSKGGSRVRVYSHGLFLKGFEECVGIAWWLPPTNKAALATYPENWKGVLSLTRLVILPGVPCNACSFLLAASRKLIDRNIWPCLVTYADTWRNHTGAIYKADNWEYKGLTKPTAIWILNGRMIAKKSRITRTNAEMINLGAEKIGSFSKHKFVRLN